MPGKRTRAKARAHRITPEALEAYRLGDWPLLHRHLGLRPWECSPLDAADFAESQSKGAFADSIPQALHLRTQLEKEAR